MPNILTIIRIIGTFPLILSLYFNGITIENSILFLILSITDFLDGFLARKYNKITEFGKIMDGIADKFLMISTTVILLIKNIIPYWTLIIFIRDFISIVFALYYKKKTNITIQSNIYGKTKTTLHIVSIALTLIFSKWTIYSSIFMLIAILLFIPEIVYIKKYVKNK